MNLQEAKQKWYGRGKCDADDPKVVMKVMDCLINRDGRGGGEVLLFIAAGLTSSDGGGDLEDEIWEDAFELAAVGCSREGMSIAVYERAADYEVFLLREYAAGMQDGGFPLLKLLNWIDGAGLTDDLGQAES